MSPDDASTNDSSIIDDDLVAALGFEPTTTIEPIADEIIDVRDIDVRDVAIPDSAISDSTAAADPDAAGTESLDGVTDDNPSDEADTPDLTAESVDAVDSITESVTSETDVPSDDDVELSDQVSSDEVSSDEVSSGDASSGDASSDDTGTGEVVLVSDASAAVFDSEADRADGTVASEGGSGIGTSDTSAADTNAASTDDPDDEPLFGSSDSTVIGSDDDVALFDIGGDDELGDAATVADPDTGSELEVPSGLGLVGEVDAPPPVVNPSSLATLDEVFGPATSTDEPTIIGDPVPDVALEPEVKADPDPEPQAAPELEAELAPAPAAVAVARTGTATAVTPAPTSKHRKLRARKVRRVVRHVDPWSVLTFSVLFHLVFFSSLLLASILVWNGAVQAGMIDNIENFVRELGDYETFNINSDVVFRAAVVIAGMLTLASSIVVVLLTVVFNLVSDLVGGIRITVVEEDTVVVPPSE